MEGKQVEVEIYRKDMVRDQRYIERWRKKAAKEKGGKKFETKTSGGIPLKSVYMSSDM